MQVASRQCLWNDTGFGTEVVVELNEETGLYLNFLVRFVDDRPVRISWGDGSHSVVEARREDTFEEHTYARPGRYKISFVDAWGIGFRPLDGRPQYSYDAAVLSVVDHSGLLQQIDSGSFKKAVNLERFIAPAARWVGQRPFAYCRKLREVKLGPVEIHYDGSFQYCPALEKFETIDTGVCWSYVWEGCTKLRELRLGKVHQFATRDFAITPSLMDIWISDKTIDQIRQVAPSGNIVAGYNAKFPWGANAMCRFHGTDGTVRADGTVLERL